MTIIQRIRALLVIRQVAHRQGITYRRCYSDMSEAIAAAWSTNDPQTKRIQVELVGEERIPTPEEFICLFSAKFFSENT